MPVILEVVQITQKLDPKVLPSDIGSAVDGMGYSTNKETTMLVNIIDGEKIDHCTLKSNGMDDGGSNFVGYQSTELTCEIKTSNADYRYILQDYSDNVGTPTGNVPVAHYELTMDGIKDGFFGEKRISYFGAIPAK